MSAQEPILRIEGLAKRFGGLEALGGVSLSVARGDFRAIIGPNGAGKSTFFNTMTGLLRPDAGRVIFEGRDVTGEPRLLLLDEPTAGMAAQERLESIRLVHRVAKELGVSCVFTEHDMAVVFAVATHITVMHQGRVLAEGTPAEVRARRQVQQVYLGEVA